jgi:hypothetical protein
MRQRAMEMLRLALAPPGLRSRGPGGGDGEGQEDDRGDLDDEGEDDDEPRQSRAARTVVH